MSRVCHFGALLVMALSPATPARAQQWQSQIEKQTTAPSPDPSPTSQVQHVLVRGSAAALEVEIQTSGAPVSPDTQAIADPDRIVVDFPGALPSAELRALQVNRGALKRVRTGLFFRDPPITRVVLDLAEPQSYRIATSANAIVVKLGPINSTGKNLSAIADAAGRNANVSHASVSKVSVTPLPAVKLQNASLAAAASTAPARIALATIAPAKVASARIPAPVSPATTAAALPAVASIVAPIATPIATNQAPLPTPLAVTYVNGLLSIRADKATLAQILFEVQRQTQAEIAIPAGAEQEDVVADLGPAPAREVLAALLNGSPYNFIFVGNEQTLERVILTLRASQ